MAPSSFGTVDADGHVRDEEARIRAYIEPPFDARLRLGSSPRDGFDNTLGGTRGTRKVDAAVWLEAMDSGGLETVVLYPTAGLSVGYLGEQDYAVAWCRAYNDYLSEEYLKVSPRFKGVALLPLQVPAEAAKELRRCVRELGMVGGMLADGPYLIGKPVYDPIYKEAERLGTMLAVHAGGRLIGGIDEFLFDRFVQVHTLGHAFSQMKQFTSVIFEGVPEKFPKLRLAFLEAGCGWVAYLLDRMDERYHIRGEVDAPVLRKTPSEYVADGNIYVSCEAEERLLPETLRLLGEGMVVYASDFPHWDADYPANLEHLLGRADLSEEQRIKITSTNARALYALDGAEAS